MPWVYSSVFPKPAPIPWSCSRFLLMFSGARSSFCRGPSLLTPKIRPCLYNNMLMMAVAGVGPSPCPRMRRDQLESPSIQDLGNETGSVWTSAKLIYGNLCSVRNNSFSSSNLGSSKLYDSRFCWSGKTSSSLAGSSPRSSCRSSSESI